ncbi:hypothetical protein NUSPORA_01253 [Nucleospora cyclopteri]
MVLIYTALASIISAKTVTEEYDEGDYKDFISSSLDKDSFFVVEEDPTKIILDVLLYGDDEKSEAKTETGSKDLIKTEHGKAVTIITALNEYTALVAVTGKLDPTKAEGQTLLTALGKLDTVSSHFVEHMKSIMAGKTGAEFDTEFKDKCASAMKKSCIPMASIKNAGPKKDKFVFAFKVSVGDNKFRTNLYEAELDSGKWKIIKKAGASDADADGFKFSDWWVITLIVVVLVAIVCAGAWYYYTHQKNKHLQEEHLNDEEEIKP